MTAFERRFQARRFAGNLKGLIQKLDYLREQGMNLSL